MLHPEIACDTVAKRGKARLARAAALFKGVNTGSGAS
jgi:hypothetical protein